MAAVLSHAAVLFLAGLFATVASGMKDHDSAFGVFCRVLCYSGGFLALFGIILAIGYVVTDIYSWFCP